MPVEEKIMSEAKAQIDYYFERAMGDATPEMVQALFMAKSSAFIDGLSYVSELSDKQMGELTMYAMEKLRSSK